MCLCVDTPSVVDYGQELILKFLNMTRALMIRDMLNTSRLSRILSAVCGY